MKLFQQLLVAPAALGLIAPLAANAAEVNIEDVASYSNTGVEVSTAQFSDVIPGDWAYTALQNLSESTGCVGNDYVKSLQNGESLTRYEAAALVNTCLEGGLASANSDATRLSTEFGTEMAILKGRVDGLEYKVEELSAGAFSSATKMTGSSVFTTGFIDTATNADNKLTSEYNVAIDLNTSFTGMDNLYVGFENGNQGDLAMDSQINTTDNALEVQSLYYSFPVGNFEVSAGPLMDQDDVISATTSIYSSAFRLAEMPWGTVGATGGSTGPGAGISYIHDNGWNGSANIIAVSGANANRGAFTQEGNDLWTVSVGYDAENYGVGAIYTNDDMDDGTSLAAQTQTDTSFGIGAYFRPEGMPTISVAYDKLADDSATDSSNLLVGFDHPLGDGVASAAFQAVDTAGTTTNNYEVYYNYPVNDGVAIQAGVFMEQVDGQDNTQGYIVETFFSF